MAATQEETAINSWIEQNNDIFANLELTKPAIEVHSDPTLWNVDDVPPNIKHATIDFLSKPALVIDYHYDTVLPPASEDAVIPQECLTFNSKTEAPINVSVEQKLSQLQMLKSILSLDDFQKYHDSRSSPSIAEFIVHPQMKYYTFEFLSINAPFDSITPIFLTLYVFDAKVGKRVSDQWTIVPEQYRSMIASDPDFADTNNFPEKMAFALQAPETLHNQDLTDHLFLMVILDRPFIMKAGAAVDSYYDKPNENNKKKAVLAAQEQCPGGWTVSFAYGAIPMSQIIQKDGPEPDEQIVTFEKVTATAECDEEFFKRKLNKVRKHPHFFPIEIKYKMSKYTPESNVPICPEYYPMNPFFKINYENKLLIKLKTVNLSLKIGMKGRNIGCRVTFYDGDQQLSVFNGRSYFKTRCQYHCSQPMFQEDILIDLPFPLTTNMYLKFEFMHLPSKRKKGPIQQCGEGTMNFIMKDTQLIMPNGDHKIPIQCDPKLLDQKSDSTKSYVLIHIHSYSNVNMSSPNLDLVMKQHFDKVVVTDFNEILDCFPLILDVIFSTIANESNITTSQPSFFALLTAISLIPITENDASDSYNNIKEQFMNHIVQPYSYLRMYAKYAALRDIDQQKFFRGFVKQWLIMQGQAVSETRHDLVTCPFLFEVLTKSITIQKLKYLSTDLVELITKLQKAVFELRGPNNQPVSETGYRVNHFLSLFYKDLIEISDRGQVFSLIKSHVLQFDVRLNNYDQVLFVDFLSCVLSVKSFICLIIPLTNNDPASSFYQTYISPVIEEGLASVEHTEKVFSILFKILITLNFEQFRIVSRHLSDLIVMFGRNTDCVQPRSEYMHVLFPLIVLLFILNNYDYSKITNYFTLSCSLLLKISTRHTSCAPVMYSIENVTDLYGLSNASYISKLVDQTQDSPFKVNIHDAWCNFTFAIQLVCLNITYKSNHIYVLSDIMVPYFDINASDALFGLLKDSLLKFVHTNSREIFTNPSSRIYKIVHCIIKNATLETVPIIDELFKIEQELFHTNNRCTAFTMRAIRRYKKSSEHLPLFQNSCVLPILNEYLNILKEFQSFNMDDPNNHEFIADIMLKLANFFRPSPDTRADVLLEIADYHIKNKYFSEAAIAQLTAAANVAEYLTVLGRLPKVFKDDHPANSFKIPCPSANHEICPDNLMRDIPTIPGFCTSKYFCECGLMQIIQMTIETCNRANLYELGTKVHQLLRPLAEARHLYKILEKHYKNGALFWTVIEQVKSKSDRELGRYYRVEFQNGDIYIYRETAFANLWQVSEKFKEKAKIFAEGKPIVVLNDGEDLSQAKMEPDKYYVHIKSVEQYFTNEEKENRITAFEQNHNIVKFYFDLPYSKSAQQSIGHLMLKRTIYTIQYPMPYIVSRVPVSPQNIEKIIFSPIEYCCESLQKQVDKINEAASRRDFTALQPLIQGSLLTQVNEGPKKMAEVFLTGAQENENTLMLRKLFREFLKVNTEAVKVHGELVTGNPTYFTLQEQLELGLNRLSSTLQPFLK